MLSDGSPSPDHVLGFVKFWRVHGHWIDPQLGKKSVFTERIGYKDVGHRDWWLHDSHLPSIYGVPMGVNAILLSGIGVPIDYGIAIVYNRPFYVIMGINMPSNTIIFMSTTIKNSSLWGSFWCQLPSKMASKWPPNHPFWPSFSCHLPSKMG